MSTAGLPVSSATVLTSPPLLASKPSWGLVPLTSPVEVSEQLESSATLSPREVMAHWQVVPLAARALTNLAATEPAYPSSASRASSGSARSASQSSSSSPIAPITPIWG